MFPVTLDNRTTVNNKISCLFWEPVFSSFGHIPRSGLLGQRVTLFISLTNWQSTVHSGHTILHSHQQCPRVQFPHSLANACDFRFVFYSRRPSGCEEGSRRTFALQPQWLRTMSTFHVLVGICVLSSEKSLFRSFARVLIRWSFRLYTFRI